MRTQLFHRPALQLLLLICLCLAFCAGGVGYFAHQPWLGIQLSADGDFISVTGTVPELAGKIPDGARILSLESPAGERVGVIAADLVEDPDILPSYQEADAFFARQELISHVMRADQVLVSWSDGYAIQQISMTPRLRSIGDIPFVFWWQILVGLIGLFISAWVYLLRSSELPVRMFLVTGVALFVSSVAAALYSSRELALPGDVFRGLSALNHAGAIVFGCAFITLFATYPKRIGNTRFLIWQTCIFVGWLVLDLLHMASNPDLGCRVPCLLQLLLAVFFAVWQWRQSRQQPLERAALKWLTLATMLGCGLAALNVMLIGMLNGTLVISQAYSFGFFMIMYLGIALGLGRYRLFDLDRWSYRVLLWLAGMVAIVFCDVLLIYAGLAQSVSLSLSLLICGGLYFPFRQWLWQKLLGRGESHIDALIPQLSGIAFLVQPKEQSDAWDQVLQSVFSPLEMSEGGPAPEKALVGEDGLALYVPACCSLAGRTLRYAGKGKRLFSTRDASFVDALGNLLSQVMLGRNDYEKGMQEERLRIGRDLHDNIGARLLKLIHYLRGDAGAEIARDAMKDLRTAIASIDGKPVPLGDALADWHAETESRCDIAGVTLHWQQKAMALEQTLSPRVKAGLESILRELVTNALKHADPAILRVNIDVDEKQMRAIVENDGRIGQPAHWQAGYGLRNIRGRLAEFGGKLDIAPSSLGVCMTIQTPFELQP